MAVATIRALDEGEPFGVAVLDHGGLAGERIEGFDADGRWSPDRAPTAHPPGDPPVNWTSTVPTVPGFFWRRTSSTDRGTIVRVDHSFDPDTGDRTLGLVRGTGVVPMHLLAACEWAGPVPYPDEPGVEPRRTRLRFDGPFSLPLKGVVSC